METETLQMSTSSKPHTEQHIAYFDNPSEGWCLSKFLKRKRPKGSQKFIDYTNEYETYERHIRSQLDFEKR